MSTDQQDHRCGCCNKPLPLGPTNYRFDRDLRANVGRCCHRSLVNAESALAGAELYECTHNPDHEK